MYMYVFSCMHIRTWARPSSPFSGRSAFIVALTSWRAIYMHTKCTGSDLCTCTCTCTYMYTCIKGIVSLCKQWLLLYLHVHVDLVYREPRTNFVVHVNRTHTCTCTCTCSKLVKTSLQRRSKAYSLQQWCKSWRPARQVLLILAAALRLWAKMNRYRKFPWRTILVTPAYLIYFNTVDLEIFM